MSNMNKFMVSILFAILMVEMTSAHLKLRLNKRNRKEYEEILADKVIGKHGHDGITDAVKKLNSELMNIQGLLVKIAKLETRKIRKELVDKLDDDDDTDAYKRENEAGRRIFHTFESLNAEN